MAPERPEAAAAAATDERMESEQSFLNRQSSREKYRIECSSNGSNGLISRFLCCMCTEVSGVENIGQRGRLSQLSWLLGALKIVYLLTYLNGLRRSKFIVLKLKFTQTTFTKPYYIRKLPPFGNAGVRNSNLLISAVMLKDVWTHILLQINLQ